MRYQVLIGLLFCLFQGPVSGNRIQLDPGTLEGLHFRHIGPIGNRVSAVVGVPGNPRIYFIGAASGGIFRTLDGGVTWEPVFDDQKVSSIGSLAIAPSDPNVIWAGTGETFIRSNVSIGNGIYRSTDQGKTWTHMGLEKTGRIGRIVVHPSDPDTVLVAAMGHCYGPQEERGIFRTTNGGKTWERVLFTDSDTGASDLVMDPNNPRILFAGMWPMKITTWGRFSGGPGGGLYKSVDLGKSWKKLEGNGLPKPPTGKIGLAMTPADSSRIYALIETNVNRDYQPLDEHQGLLWRSDDGGETWKMVNADHTLSQRPHYYHRMAVLPDDPDEVHFMSLRHSISLDGGVTYKRGNAGGDHHDIWIDPLIPERMIVGHDQGISISNNRGKTWFRPQLPIAQIYHAYTDNRIPYFVYGNRQDGTSVRGPSNSLTGGSIPIGMWKSVGGCESGFAVPDPSDNTTVWSGCYDGILDVHDLETGHTRNVSVWPEAAESWPAKDLKYRFQWTFPIALSPHDPKRVYVGSQYVHRTKNRGQSWEVISPDLTTNDPSRQVKTGGLTPDDAGPTIAPVVFAIAESPLREGLIWAGTNDGLVQMTRNGGRTWENVTGNLEGLPPWGTVSNIEPSRYDEGICYLSVDLHQENDPRPYIYRTRDFGKTWVRIVNGIPESPLSYVHCVREDPIRRGLLYAGTENALYISFDDGENWGSFQADLPHAPVYWITVQEHFNDLVVATYGRGFWILDDLTPIQQLTAETPASDAHLFQPRPAYRFRRIESHMSQPGDPAAGENPVYGAAVNFYLREVPEADVSIRILDEDEKTVRRFSKQGPDDKLELRKGFNRLYWDLRLQSSRQGRLLTRPKEHAHVGLGDRGWRTNEELRRRAALLVPPGKYRVELNVGDMRQVQELEVLKDPNSHGSIEDIRKQYGLTRELYRMVNGAVDMINELELMRRQAIDLADRLSDRIDGVDVIRKSLRDMETRLAATEDRFSDLRLTGAGQDTLRWPRKFYAKLISLIGLIEKSDYPPTDSQAEVFTHLKQNYWELETEMAQLRNEVENLNRILQEADIRPILLGDQLKK